MASLIEAIDVKRKTFFEMEDVPYVCLEQEISKPTARGGQTLVRLKMRNLLTRAVFDKTFKAGEKFEEVSKAPLGEPAFATPAFADGRAYVRTVTSLYCFGKK